MMSNIEVEIEEWANCSPYAIIKLMKELDNGDRGENTKEFYISYPDWAKLFFQKLTVEKQNKIY